MSDHDNRKIPADEGVYEMPRSVEDLKHEYQTGCVSMLAGFLWLLFTGFVIYGIFRLHNAHTLVAPNSTEYSHILSLIVFLPLVAIFFNVISPAKNLFFIRMNTIVYALITFGLAMFMLFGYAASKTDDGSKMIYKDQLGNQLTITPEGIYNPIIPEGVPAWSYTIVDNVQMVKVDNENEPVRPVLVKNYYYNRTKSGMQFEELRPWVNVTDRPALNVGESEYTIAKFQFHLGVDGISFPLILLTALLSVLSLIASFSITMRLKEYMSWFLLLMVGMYGTFCALDYILFYVFWELILVPMYFLIGIWGGPRKEYAALKFFLYTLFGSVFLLIGIIALYFVTGQQTFDIIMLQGLAAQALGTKDMYHIQVLLFLCFFLSFAIKVPIFPFHTWLPDAHVEAPTAVSVILAGILLKMGTYGFFRMSFPTFPEATYHLAPALGVLAVIISGSLFLLVGVLYDRAHTRDLNAFGGLLPQMRMFGIIMVIASMANLGLPGLAGFWGEFLSLLGAVQQKEFLTSNGFVFFRILAPIALIGIIITAGYMLLMIRKVFMGPMNEKWNWLPDMDARELIAVLPLIALMIFIGVYPNPLIYLFQTNVLELVNQIRYAAGVMPVAF
ncbi:MAG: NADH-quinone oxidoreductase subunit M [bacterium]|nr:NADH-quinone oxidoreductase subunit M [bacterium]